MKTIFKRHDNIDDNDAGDDMRINVALRQIVLHQAEPKLAGYKGIT